jgi:hypothetical protein
MLSFYELEGQIKAQMKEAHVPGFALAIVQDLQVLYAKGSGRVLSTTIGGLWSVRADACTRERRIENRQPGSGFVHGRRP